MEPWDDCDGICLYCQFADDCPIFNGMSCQRDCEDCPEQYDCSEYPC